MQKLPKDRRSLSCSLITNGKDLEVSIQDSGPGIAAKDLKKLFDPWFTTKGSHGMGIGLFLTREIIQRHGGSIEVSSTEGNGTTFVIRLPDGLKGTEGPAAHHI